LDNNSYAIKQLPITGKTVEDHLSDLLIEVTCLAKLVHPNIVRYYQAWIEEESYDFLTTPSKKTPVPFTMDYETEDEEEWSKSSTEFIIPDQSELLSSSGTVLSEKTRWEDLKKYILRSLPPQKQFFFVYSNATLSRHIKWMAKFTKNDQPRTEHNHFHPNFKRIKICARKGSYSS